MKVFDVGATLVVSVGVVAAYCLQSIRWLRVLQREHYQPGSVVRFYRRWAFRPVSSLKAPAVFRDRPPLPLTPFVLVAALGLLLSGQELAAAAVLALHGCLFPAGLPIHGRTSPLAWTRRVRVVAALSLFVSAALMLFSFDGVSPWIMASIVLVSVAPVLDFSAWLLQPFENRVAQRFVAEAAQRLVDVHPTVVAITGSFGKTSTKHHLAELLGGRHGVVPSPRSYNNRAGLSRAINENVSSGTKIFIAEMGTYGPGEIRDLCAWCVPSIAIITAIAPVHLERMGSLDVIESAKYEITEQADTIIVNLDDPRLATWVPRLTAEAKTVRTGGSLRADADVRVQILSERWHIAVDGTAVAIAPLVVGVREENLACAIAAALSLGVPLDEIVSRLPHLTVVPNRMVVATAPSGVMVIDDTFNANPAGARSALGTLMTLPINGRRVVVTPGMVELGSVQYGANEEMARQSADNGAELVIVGRTNARALLDGYGPSAHRVATREDAVEWVRRSLVAGDGVLYLNDLPDHYP